MQLIYSFSLKFYNLIIWLVSFKNEKAKKWIVGRKNVFTQIQSKKEKEYSIWMHCASLGEFEQGKPVIEKLLDEIPNSTLTLTFFSPSGYENKKSYGRAKQVFYLPLDSRNNAKKWYETLKPNLFLSVKYEIWPFYLREGKSRGVSNYLISSNFRSSQIYFKVFGSFFRNALRNYDSIMVQNEDSKMLLDAISVKSIVTGDTRYDRVNELTETAFEDQKVSSFIATEKKVIVFGSTYPIEHILIKEVIENSKFETKKIIIAPHNIDEKTIKELSDLFPNAVKYSLFNKDQKETNMLIIDSIGLLSRLYRFADLTYVGGGFGKSLHNALEAVAYGVPVVVGPAHNKFPEVKELIAHGGVIEVGNKAEFLDLFADWNFQSDRNKNRGMLNKAFVQQRLGATVKSVNEILKSIHD